MKDKKVIHNEIEKCTLTLEEIDTSAERYSIILECNGDMINNVVFFRGNNLQEVLTGELQKAVEMVKKRNVNKGKSIAAKFMPTLIKTIRGKQ